MFAYLMAFVAARLIPSFARNSVELLKYN